MAETKTAEPWGKNVLVEFEDGIAWVTMNRPDKRNAINIDLAREMVEVVDALEVDDRCGVFVLTGAGDAFSAGMDLKGYFRASDTLSDVERSRIYRINATWQWRRLLYYPKPTNAMGERRVLRGCVYAALRGRLGDRRQGSALRPLGDQLGDPSRRHGLEGDGRSRPPARGPLLRDDRRDIQRHEGGRARLGQRGRAAGEAAGTHPRPRQGPPWEESTRPAHRPDGLQDGR